MPSTTTSSPADDAPSEPKASWCPPTPSSSRIRSHDPNLPVDHLVLLPPPALVPSSDRCTAARERDPIRDGRIDRAREADEDDSGRGCGTLPHLVPDDSSRSALVSHEDPTRSTIETSQECSVSTTTAKRPRRTAAIAAARKMPRPTSPETGRETPRDAQDHEGFDDEEDDGNDDDDDDEYEGEGRPRDAFSPPRWHAGSKANPTSARHPLSSIMASAADTASLDPSTSAPTTQARSKPTGSKRKISHSLIERRRREKINDCLAHLKDTVPNLREQGEQKLAKAKERGRKRGKGDEAGERGGLHKLEILQGTIEHIDNLRKRIADLEREAALTRFERPASVESSAVPSSSSPSDPLSLPPPLLSTSSFGSSSSSIISSSTATSTVHASTTETNDMVDRLDEQGRAADMLLYFSTSPELRPVRM
ncbi:hypothetical protein JCM10212_006044 [Sporobolomyces blumeae]